LPKTKLWSRTANSPAGKLLFGAAVTKFGKDDDSDDKKINPPNRPSECVAETVLRKTALRVLHGKKINSSKVQFHPRRRQTSRSVVLRINPAIAKEVSVALFLANRQYYINNGYLPVQYQNNRKKLLFVIGTVYCILRVFE
jgi:hypothetical protein